MTDIQELFICIHCKQIRDETIKNFMNMKPCNAPDGDGHLFKRLFKSYKKRFTDKFPYQYTIEIDWQYQNGKGYIIHTTNEDKWNKLKEKIITDKIMFISNERKTKLEIMGFDVIVMDPP